MTRYWIVVRLLAKKLIAIADFPACQTTYSSEFYAKQAASELATNYPTAVFVIAEVRQSFKRSEQIISEQLKAGY